MFSPGHSEPGGAAGRSRLIATGLAERGWEVRVVTRAGTLRRFHLRRSRALSVLEVPGFGAGPSGALLFFACALPLGLVWGWRATAFLAIQLKSQATAAALCSLSLGRPYIALSTSSGRFSEARYVLEAPLSGIRRRLVGRAAALVAQTPEGATELEALVPPGRVAVVPNPVETVDAPPLNNRPRVLYAGRLSDEKDLGRLLECWRGLVERRPEAHLTLVGEGGHYRSVEDELRRTVAGDPVLRSSVSFIGWVADVGRHLRESDVFVFPSLDEGMSNSLLEACAWRRVVVASDIAPNRAILGHDYPLLFPAGDSRGLTAALDRALGDAAARQAALDRLEGRMSAFSTDTVMGCLEDLLLAAADRPRH